MDLKTALEKCYELLMSGQETVVIIKSKNKKYVVSVPTKVKK